MKKISLLFFLIVPFVIGGCKQKLNPTWVRVSDSVRHYYPIIMGANIDLTYEIQNAGKEPLIISDIQPSCGCIIQLEKDNVIIFPGKKRKLTFHFDSSTNMGYVKQTIRIYANVLPRGEIDLIFDANVVPPDENIEDYETIYEKHFKEEVAEGIKTTVDGDNWKKGYYVSSDDYSE